MPDEGQERFPFFMGAFYKLQRLRHDHIRGITVKFLDPALTTEQRINIEKVRRGKPLVETKSPRMMRVCAQDGTPGPRRPSRCHFPK